MIAVVGVLSLASIISVGLFLLPLPIAGAILLLTRPRRMITAGVLLIAAGFGPLILAYLNHPGPGHICHTDHQEVFCGDYLNPWPWLALGAALWLAAAVLFLLATRRHSPPRRHE
jgi:hypothetical protein